MYRQFAELDDILIDPSISVEDNGLPTTATGATELTNGDDTYADEEHFEDYTEDFDENSPVKKQGSVLLSEGEESAFLEDSQFVDANPANMYKNKKETVKVEDVEEETEKEDNNNVFVDANPANMHKAVEAPKVAAAPARTVGQLFPVMENSRETSPEGNDEPEKPKPVEHVQVPTPRSLTDSQDEENIMYIKNRRLGVTAEQLRKLKHFEPLLAHELMTTSEPKGGKGRALSFDTASSSRGNANSNSSGTAATTTATSRPSGRSFTTESARPQDITTIPPPPRSSIIQPSYLNFSNVTQGSLPGEDVHFSRTFNHSAPPLSENWQSLAAKSSALQQIARPNTDDSAMMRAVYELMNTAKQHTRQNNSEGLGRYEEIALELQDLIAAERRKLKQSQTDRLQEQESALLALLRAKSVPPTYHYNQQVVLLSEYLRNRHQESDANAGHCIFLIDSKNRSTSCSDQDLRDSLSSVNGGTMLTACNSKRSGGFVMKYNHCLVTVVTISMHYSHSAGRKPAPKVIFICGPKTIPPLNTSRITKGPHANNSNVSSIILRLFNANGNANNQYDPDNVEFNKQIEILYHSVFPRQDDALDDADVQKLLVLQQKSGLKFNRKESNEKISRYEQLLLEIEELIRLQKQKQVNEDGVIDRLFYLSQSAARKKSPVRRDPGTTVSGSIPVQPRKGNQSPGRRSCEACNVRSSQQMADANNKPPFYTSTYYSNHHTFQPHASRRSLNGTATSSALRGSTEKFAPQMSASEPLRRSTSSNNAGNRRSRAGGSRRSVDFNTTGETMNLVLDGSPLEEGERETVKVDKDDYYRYLLTRLQVTQPNVTLSCDKIYTNFLSDMIDVCKRRSHECDSAEEIAMHRALSGYVAESFAASSIDRIRAGMVRSALEMQRNSLDD